MGLDINLFRKEKGGDPDKIKESIKNRYKDDSIVDEIIELDQNWRKSLIISEI
jgi:seryl-tRNA synthetase